MKAVRFDSHHSDPTVQVAFVGCNLGEASRIVPTVFLLLEEKVEVSSHSTVHMPIVHLKQQDLFLNLTFIAAVFFI